MVISKWSFYVVAVLAVSYWDGSFLSFNNNNKYNSQVEFVKLMEESIPPGHEVFMKVSGRWAWNTHQQKKLNSPVKLLCIKTHITVNCLKTRENALSYRNIGIRLFLP